MVSTLPRSRRSAHGEIHRPSGDVDSFHVAVAVLLLIPCVGLIALLVLNSQATSELKKAGLRVGLLGADPGQFNGWR